MTKRFGGLFLADCFLFSLLYVLIDSLSQVEEFARNSSGLLGFLKIAFTYYSYDLPGLFCLLLGPVTTLASAAFAVTLTARGNEFVPVLAAGISLQRLLAPIVLLSALVSAGTLAIQELWIPRHRDEILASKAYGRGGSLIRQAHYTDRAQGIVVIAEKYFPLERRGENILVLSKGKDRPRSFLIHARSMSWVEPEGGHGYWRLETGGLQEYDAAGEIIPKPAPPAAERSPPPAPAPQAPPSNLDAAPAASPAPQDPDPPAQRLSEPFEARRLVETGMIPQDLENNERRNLPLTLAELERKIAVAPDRHRWQIRYYSRIADPLHSLILVLLGVPIILSRDTRNIFFSALLAALISTAYFIFNAGMVYLGNRGTLDPPLAVWLGPILFGSLGVTMYFRMRT